MAAVANGLIQQKVAHTTKAVSQRTRPVTGHQAVESSVLLVTINTCRHAAHPGVFAYRQYQFE